MDTKREGVIEVNAPQIGEHVELVEGNVGDAFDLIAYARECSHMDFMLHALSISLRVDGRRFSFEELREWPGRRFRSLLKLGPKALELNSFGVDDDEESEEGKS